VSAALAVLYRPREAFAVLAAAPRIETGLAAVLATALASMAIEVAANALGSGGAAGLVISLILPLLFLAYWLLDAWLVDAGAGMLGRNGRRRAYLAVSGFAFLPLTGYAVLAFVEAAATRWNGPGPDIASGLAWLTLLAIAWFLVLTVLAIRAVYDVPALNAVALALLPYAALSGALLLLGIVLGVLHAAGVV